MASKEREKKLLLCAKVWSGIQMANGKLINFFAMYVEILLSDTIAI